MASLRPKVKCSAHKRWSQHIVATNSDDVCVLLKYQTRHHSQDDLSLIQRKISHIPPKTYSTLTHYHSKTNKSNNDNDSNNNHNNYNDLNNMYIDRVVLLAASKGGGGGGSVGGGVSSTKIENNNFTDTSGVTKTCGKRLAAVSCVNGHRKLPQQPPQQQTANYYRRRSRLIRPISSFEPTDHVWSAQFNFLSFFFLKLKLCSTFSKLMIHVRVSTKQNKFNYLLLKCFFLVCVLFLLRWFCFYFFLLRRKTRS